MTVLELDTPHGRANAHLHPAAGRESRARARSWSSRRRDGAGPRRGHQRCARGGRERRCSSNSPTVSPGGALRLRHASSTLPGRRSSTSCCAGELRGLPLIVGGRSSGARVACRTAEATGAVGVLCLAFPLQPPRRATPAPSRLSELDAVAVADSGRAGLTRRFRDPTRRSAANGGAGRGRPQPEDGSRRGGGCGSRLAPASSWVRVGLMDWKLELVAIPVSDVDRAKSFYVDKVGFNADHDHTVSDEIRFVQLTPPGSACSIALGNGTREHAARLGPGTCSSSLQTSRQLVRSSSSAESRSATSRSSTGARSSSSATPTATAGLSSRSRPATSPLA